MLDCRGRTRRFGYIPNNSVKCARIASLPSTRNADSADWNTALSANAAMYASRFPSCRACNLGAAIWGPARGSCPDPLPNPPIVKASSATIDRFMASPTEMNCARQSVRAAHESLTGLQVGTGRYPKSGPAAQRYSVGAAEQLIPYPFLYRGALASLLRRAICVRALELGLSPPRPQTSVTPNVFAHNRRSSGGPPLERPCSWAG